MNSAHLHKAESSDLHQIHLQENSSGGTAHGDYGFSDDETEEVSLVVDSVEDDLEGARQARAAELRKEAPLEFSE